MNDLGHTQLLDLLDGVRSRQFQAVVLTPAELARIRSMAQNVQPVRPTLPPINFGPPRR
jgi:hypothetical protein